MADLAIHRCGWVSTTHAMPGGVEVKIRAKTESPDGEARRITCLILSGEHINSAVTSRLPTGWLESRIRAVEDLIRQFDDIDNQFAALADAGQVMAVDSAAGSGTERPKLGRPDGGDPESFYALVAQAHRDAVRQRVAVAPALAEEAGVPVRTAHRWISEARRRGHLPLGRSGKRGK